MADKTGLLIIDHGSRRPHANRVVRQVAAMVRDKSRFLIVQHAHMELAEPTIQQGFETCVEAGVEAIVVQPYFLGPGRHSTSDIPRMVREAARNHPQVTICFSAPLGPHPKMGELILERIREAKILHGSADAKS